jgi:hypothetical protein
MSHTPEGADRLLIRPLNGRPGRCRQHEADRSNGKTPNDRGQWIFESRSSPPAASLNTAPDGTHRPVTIRQPKSHNASSAREHPVMEKRHVGG